MIYQPVQPEMDNYYYHYLVMWSWVRTSPHITMMQQFAYNRQIDSDSRYDGALVAAMTGLNRAVREIAEHNA